jgi:hypothetical protein
LRPFRRADFPTLGEDLSHELVASEGADRAAPIFGPLAIGPLEQRLNLTFNCRYSL